MMTREEAIEELDRLLWHWDELENGKRCFWGYDNEAVALALTALRPVSREQVEKVWKGCSWCNNEGKNPENWECSLCGSVLMNTVICTYPPIPCKDCPSCGWHWEGTPEPIEYRPVGGNGLGALHETKTD